MVNTEVAEAVLGRLEPGSEGEATVIRRHTELTRFATSHIHQNLAEHDATLRVRVRRDARTGVSSTNRLSPSGLDEVVARATAIAAHAAPDPDPPPLAEPGEGAVDSDLGWIAETDAAAPEH